jgi:hypothetical protein
MTKRKILLVALGGLVAVSAIVIPTRDPATHAALPQPPGGVELTSFVIDGNPDGPNDWDNPYTAPGLTPIPSS